MKRLHRLLDFFIEWCFIITKLSSKFIKSGYLGIILQIQSTDQGLSLDFGDFSKNLKINGLLTY